MLKGGFFFNKTVKKSNTLRKSFDQPAWKEKRGVVEKPNQVERSCFGLLLPDLHNASPVPQTNVSVVAGT